MIEKSNKENQLIILAIKSKTTAVFTDQGSVTFLPSETSHVYINPDKVEFITIKKDDMKIQ